MSFRGSLPKIVSENPNGLLSLHPSWRRVELKEVASVLNGFAFSSKNFTKSEGVPLLRIRDILQNRTEAHYSGDYDPTYTVESGDLVAGMDGDFNCALWKGPVALLNQRVCKILPDERYYLKKLLAFILPGYLRAIHQNTSSVTVKHLSSNTVAEIPLPLPPIQEQRRIVAEIEKQFTRLDAAVQALKRIKANLKRYRASVLKAACEGRLVPTEAELARSEGRSYEPASGLLKRILAERRARWEADQLAKMTAAGKPHMDDRWKARYKEPAAPDTSNLPVLQEGWAWVTVGGISNKVVDGVHKKPNYVKEGVPFVTVKNLTAGLGINFDDLNYVTEEDHKEFTKRANPEFGDILITKDGTLGVVRLIRSETVFSIFVSVALIKPVLRSLSAFLELALTSPQVQIQMVPKGSGLQHIHLEDLRLDCVPIPPLAEQKRIVAEIERRLSVIDELEIVVEANLKRAGRLRQAILKRAFEGKLVPQDPNDEPASLLLERIKVERSERAAHAKPRPEKQSVRLRA